MKFAIIFALGLVAVSACRTEYVVVPTVELFATDNPVGNFTVVDTLQTRSDGSLYEALVTIDQDTFLVTLHPNAILESISSSVNHKRRGLLRVFDQQGILISVTLAADSMSHGFKLEFMGSYLAGYFERDGLNCKGGKGFGFDPNGDITYAGYSDCSEENLVESIFKGSELPYLRSITVNGQEVTALQGDSLYSELNHPQFDTYSQLWPDTAWINASSN